MNPVTFPLMGWPAFYMTTAPTIPSFYWDVVSDEQRIKEICCRLGSLIDYVQTLTDGENQTASELEELKALFEQFQESGFDDYYKEQIQEWIKNNLATLWGMFASQVYFGITDNGYFCAYVPESWNDIEFDTGAVYGTDQYGRLILRYDVLNGQGVIDNTAPDYEMIGE